jgi:hypothetical protein
MTTALYLMLPIVAVVGPMLLWVWQDQLRYAGRCLCSWEWWRPKLDAGSVIGLVTLIPVACVFGLIHLFMWFAA